MTLLAIRRGPRVRVLGLVVLVSLVVLYVVWQAGQSARATQWVTAREGAIVSLGNDVAIRISPGALPADSTVTLAVASQARPVGEFEAAEAVGGAVNLDVDGGKLLKPVTLSDCF